MDINAIFLNFKFYFIFSILQLFYDQIYSTKMSERETDKTDMCNIKHKKACNTNDKYHTYTCMVQKGYWDNVELHVQIKKYCE